MGEQGTGVTIPFKFGGRRREMKEERKRLVELEETRKRQAKIQEARRRNLGGAFALTEDDIVAEKDEDIERERVAAQRAKAERRARERITSLEDVPVTSASASQLARMPIAPPSVFDTSTVTAADIDGVFHEHKFSKVWKDWDASKKDNPGEVARQFMRIAAVKRRGYSPNRRRRSLSKSRSRSRERRRR